jgi:putative superfamily III holin-X
LPRPGGGTIIQEGAPLAVLTEPKRPPGNEGIATMLKGTADAMGHLLAGHLKLARLELVEDAKALGPPAAVVAVAALLAVIGYGLVVLGLAAILRPLLGTPGALFLLGGVHLAVGGAAAWLAVGRMKRVKVLDESTHEASGSMATLGTAAGEPGRTPAEMEKALDQQQRRPELPESQESRGRSGPR